METTAKPEGVKRNGQRRVLLRLDGGSIVGQRASFFSDGSAGVILLSVEQAATLGRVSQKEVERLQRLISLTSSSPAPLDRALPNGSAGPQHVHETEAELCLPPNKRQRFTAGAGTTANGGHHHPSSPSHTSKDLNKPDWLSKCSELLRETKKELGQEASWFQHPVDCNMYKEYRKVVSHPMAFADIEHKIAKGLYQGPQDFAEDVRLVWKNCKLFNGVDQPVGKIGLKGEAIFERLWSASGFCADAGRTKRLTAGVAAEKFDPDEYEAPPSKTKSVSKGPKSGSKNKNGLSRTKSHEVTSGHRGGQHTIPAARLSVVAELLQTLEPPNLENAVALINEEAKGVGEDGDLELDFEQIKPESFAKLDKFLRALQSKARKSSSGRSHSYMSGRNGSVRLEQDSDTDSDSDSGYS